MNEVTEKILCSLAVLIWQIILSIWMHFQYKNKKYDLFNAIYQIVLFTILQLIYWL